MNLTEKLSQVDWTVVDELHHIPHGRKGSLQETMRTEYVAYRKLHRELGGGPPRLALFQAIFNIRRTHPGFNPRYDADFFFGHGAMSSTLAGDPLSAQIHAAASSGGAAPLRPRSHVAPDDQGVQSDHPAAREPDREVVGAARRDG